MAQDTRPTGIEIDNEQQTIGGLPRTEDVPVATADVYEGEKAIVLSADQAARYMEMYDDVTGGIGGLGMTEEEFVDWWLEMLATMVVWP